MMVFDADLITPWVIDKNGGGQYFPGTTSAIGRIKDGQIIGGIYYEKYNGANIWCHIASADPRWLNKTFLWMIFDYPFRVCGVKRMTAPVIETNHACRKFVERLGFEAESTMVKGHSDGDVIIYRLLKEDCKWLEIKNV